MYCMYHGCDVCCYVCMFKGHHLDTNISLRLLEQICQNNHKIQAIKSNQPYFVHTFIDLSILFLSRFWSHLKKYTQKNLNPK